MATRSNIGILKDGKIRAIYSHFDGYPSGVGQTLRDHYTDVKKIEKLLDLGNVSSLEENITKPEGHSFNNRIDGYSLFYERDRGDEGQEAQMYDSLDEVQDNDYTYIWDDEKGKWFFTDNFGDKRKIDLATADLDKFAKGGVLTYDNLTDDLSPNKKGLLSKINKESENVSIKVEETDGRETIFIDITYEGEQSKNIENHKKQIIKYLEKRGVKKNDIDISLEKEKFDNKQYQTLQVNVYLTDKQEKEFFAKGGVTVGFYDEGQKSMRFQQFDNREETKKFLEKEGMKEVKKDPKTRNEFKFYAEGGDITYYSNRTSKDFQLGELVYDTGNMDYGTIINIFPESIYEVRLDSDGVQPTENLRKLGEVGDRGTKKQLFDAVASIERLRREYPKNGYPELINNPFYEKGGMTGPLKLAITPNEFSPKVEEILDEYGVEYRLDPDYEQLHRMGEGKMYIIDDYEEEDLEDAKKALSMKVMTLLMVIWMFLFIKKVVK